MALITKTYTFSAGAVIVASEHNSNFDTLYNDYNGNITNANIASGAAIADTKLAQITTSNKVALSALTAAGNYTPTGIWDFSGATLAGASPLVFEGATADDFETTITVTDPTADNTITIPDSSITLAGEPGGIDDYGTSLTSATAKTLANLKFAYGVQAVSAGATDAVVFDNISFTSSGSYVVVLGLETDTNNGDKGTVLSKATTGFSIKNHDAATQTYSWLAIGT